MLFGTWRTIILSYVSNFEKFSTTSIASENLSLGNSSLKCPCHDKSNESYLQCKIFNFLFQN